jgi:hypothetical protein
MSRSQLSFIFALAAATQALLGATASLAQPTARGTSQRQDESPRELVEAVQILRSQGVSVGIPSAIKKLEEASGKYPELPTPHVIMYYLLRSNQPILARLQLNDAVKSNPNDPEPYLILAEFAVRDRRLPEAALCLEKAAQLLAVYKGPANRKSVMEQTLLANLAQLAEARASWKEAEYYLRILLKNLPTDLTAHQRLAKALFQQGPVFRQEAYDVLKRAKKIDRDFAKKNNTRETILTPEAYMAKFFWESEGAASANVKLWFDAAVKNAPNDLATRQVAAQWALECGNLDFVKQQVAAIVKIEESDSALYGGSTSGHMLRGLVALREKRWADAEKDFDWVLLQSRDDIIAKNNMALALVEQEPKENPEAKKHRALRFAESNESEQKKLHDAKDPGAKFADALSTLIWVAFKNKQFEEVDRAIDAYQKLVGEIRDPDTLTYVAHYLKYRESNWQAKQFLESALHSGQQFGMKPEALALYEKVKDAKRPEGAATDKTP